MNNLSELDVLIDMYNQNVFVSAISYFGKFKNYAYLTECTHDEEIMDLAFHVVDEVNKALEKKYKISSDELHERKNKVIKGIKEQTENEVLINNSICNLVKERNLVDSAMLCIENGLMPYYLSKSIAAAFINNDFDEGNKSIKNYILTHDIKSAIKYYCGLDKEKELIQMITDHYVKLITLEHIKEDHKKADFIKKAFELGFQYELDIKGCAQCTLAALFEATGKFHSILFQSAGGLAGGMALSGDGACGGYTGGIMLMGSFVGRRFERMQIDGDKAAKVKSYIMSQKLRDKYIETYGSVICKDIHREIFGRSYLIRDKEQNKEFELAGAHTTKCTTVVGNACAWIAEILLDEGLVEFE